ncbi:MAG: lipid-A-disaccharide synthase [Chitinophagales bacterium]|jgi:lipid-A-disaccharide synthase
MKYYLIAGEASGDLHGANLMKAIAKKDASASFRFWGGDKMNALEGSVQVEHYKNTAFMGFVEVLKHLPTIFRFIKKCKEDILAYQPDTIIFIDYPGFNLRIAKFAKLAGFKTIYYISPQVWAWKESRVKKIKQYIDKMLVILPFEKPFYDKWNYAVDYVGHPLLDEISNQEYHLSLRVDKPIIALLPGSRKQEIQTILPSFLSIVSKFPAYQFVIAGLDHIDANIYQELIQDKEVLVVKNETYELLSKSAAALVASGTATLECAIFGVPMLVGYRGNFISYHMGKYLIKVPYIALVNILAERKIVPELIQNDLNPQNLEANLKDILSEVTNKEMKANFKQMVEVLGNSGASEKAAEIIVKS